MKPITVTVLFGGHSSEYEVSLQSAAAVIGQLDPVRYHVVPLGITREGRWLLYGGDVQEIRDDSWSHHGSCVPAIISPDRGTRGILVTGGPGPRTIPVDAALPILHGKHGEDGTVQGLLELAGIPCAGCGLLSSALCMDKDVAHRLVKQAGIRVPDCAVLHAPVLYSQLLSQTEGLRYPLFVKPANAGSSFGITRVSDPSGLPDAIREALRHDRKVIVEEAVEGYEVGCAILGNDALTIGEVDEIELSRGFFDYREKYTLETSKIHMPARIDAETAARVKRAAEVVYRTLGCSGLARVDLFLTSGGELVFNEVNTLPGFTSHSRYPNMLKGIGLSFSGILDELIRLAMEE